MSASAILDSDTCELCGRKVPNITRHHLIPQTRHKNKRNKKQFDREDVKSRIALLCRPCHSHVHKTLCNKDLEREFNTIETLRQHPDISKFVAWIKNKPVTLKVSFDGGKNR